MNQEEKSAEEHKKEKIAAEEARMLVGEQARKKAYLTKEEAIEKASKLRVEKRAPGRAEEEAKQRTKELERKKAMLAREKAIEEAQEARKLKKS